MDKIELKIRIFGDPVLRKKAKPVNEVTPEHRKILSEMARMMYAESGVGLAALQVGICESMAVIDIGKGLYKLVNPVIVKKEGAQFMEEGCLSVPGISIEVKRAAKVTVKAQDEDFKPLIIEAEGLLAWINEKTQKVVLAHLSEQNNTPEIALSDGAQSLDPVQFEHVTGRIRDIIDWAGKTLG